MSSRLVRAANPGGVHQRRRYFGTALTLGHHRHPDPQAGEWLAAPARSHAAAMPVSAMTPARAVFFRGLRCPDGLVAILTNPDAECLVQIAFRGEFPQVEEVLGATRLTTTSRDGLSYCDVKYPPGA